MKRPIFASNLIMLLELVISSQSSLQIYVNKINLYND